MSASLRAVYRPIGVRVTSVRRLHRILTILKRLQTVAKRLKAAVAGAAVTVVVAVVVRIGSVQNHVAHQINPLVVVHQMMQMNATTWTMTGQLALMMMNRLLKFRDSVANEVDRTRGGTVTAEVLAETARNVVNVVGSLMIAVGAVRVRTDNGLNAASVRSEANVM